MSDFSLTLVLQIKSSKIINDMAKVSIKYEKKVIELFANRYNQIFCYIHSFVTRLIVARKELRRKRLKKIIMYVPKENIKVL